MGLRPFYTVGFLLVALLATGMMPIGHASPVPEDEDVAVWVEGIGFLPEAQANQQPPRPSRVHSHQARSPHKAVPAKPTTLWMQSSQQSIVPTASPNYNPSVLDNFTQLSALGGLAQWIQQKNPALHPSWASTFAESLLQIAAQHQLDFRLLSSVIAVESSFRPLVVSSSGAIGLGQLKPATAKGLGVSDPYNPFDNMQGAALYLRQLLNRYSNNVEKALAAYYTGPGTVDRKGVTQPGQAYANKVLRVMASYPPVS